MLCLSWDNKQTKSKRFALVLIIIRPNQNILLQFWKQADQIKLVRFVPEPMGQNGNELLLIQKNSDQTKTFCFLSDLKQTKSKRFAFVPIISFDIGAFLLSFRYCWHYYSQGLWNLAYCAMVLLPYTIHVENRGNGTRYMYFVAPPPFFITVFANI